MLLDVVRFVNGVGYYKSLKNYLLDTSCMDSFGCWEFYFIYFIYFFRGLQDFCLRQDRFKLPDY